VAPGIDVQRDVVERMEFIPIMKGKPGIFRLPST